MLKTPLALPSLLHCSGQSQRCNEVGFVRSETRNHSDELKLTTKGEWPTLCRGFVPLREFMRSSAVSFVSHEGTKTWIS